ncbi:acyltransferase [Mucilaginibacter sp. 14171R-50]|uniref:acyltransferase family protein n=1 Tax=Mucilaginibacter sp. 14171R-50 TaxID=2703789 RepID=UPI00138BA6C1|nr:acyltransferase [Mucilaginibacter sp. 14171R-50]QHS54313.1 acyltransferase [Mucilaginibacter sp. 14171R-50]
MSKPEAQPALVHPKQKINYIDHLKVMLTVLVIMHHSFIAYGAPGGWYYTQKTTLTAALIPMTAFVAVNQAFFMGFFFFLSALFVPSSYDKKGPVKFITDRLMRLGLPLVFYSFILSPILSYIPYNWVGEHHITYLQYLGGFNSWIDFGVLWFVAALLLFTFIYVLYRIVIKQTSKTVAMPTVTTILVFALIIGVISYVVRIVFPVGWVLKPVGFQLGHFPQYVSLFILGLIASKSKWLNHAEYKTGKRMRTIALCVVLIGFPLFFIVRNLLNFPVAWFTGGIHWQSLWYAVWEQLVGFAIISSLLGIGKYRWNKSSAFLSKLSRSTFAVYIFHPLIIISLSVMARNWGIDPAIKLLVVAPTAVVLSFLLGLAIVRIPGVNKVV